MRGTRRLILGFGLVLAAAGCEQAVRTLAPEVRSIHVVEFKNLTNDAGLPSQLHEDIRRALRLDARLAVRDESQGADAVLDGSVAEYSRVPARYDANNVVQEYRLRLVVELTLTDASGQRSLWAARGAAPAAPAGAPTRRLEQSTNQVVVPAAGLAVETEEAAQRRMIRDLAQDVVVKVIEGW